MTTKRALVAVATAAATITALPTAHADPNAFYQFLSPSGNVACQMGGRDDGTGYAWCKADQHTWAAPATGYCPIAYIPGAIGEPGGADLQLSQGNAPCLGFVMSQIFFSGPYALRSLIMARRTRSARSPAAASPRV